MKTADGIEYTAGMTLYLIHWNDDGHYLGEHKTTGEFKLGEAVSTDARGYRRTVWVEDCYADRTTATKRIIQILDEEITETQVEVNKHRAEIGESPVHTIRITEERAITLLLQHGLADREGWVVDDTMVADLEALYPHLKRDNYYRAEYPNPA